MPAIGDIPSVNFAGFGCSEGAVTFIDSPEEIDRILPEVAARKSPVSMLRDTGTWDDSAAEILRLVTEQG